jgi:hypothetical protein
MNPKQNSPWDVDFARRNTPDTRLLISAASLNLALRHSVTICDE